MDETLTHALRDDQEPTTEDRLVASIPRPSARPRQAERPKFVAIPRLVLRDGRVGDVASALFGLALKLGVADVANARVAEWLGVDRVSVWRGRVRLRELGLVDATGEVAVDWKERTRPTKRVDGELLVQLDDVASLGLKNAIAFAQLTSAATLRGGVDATGFFDCESRFFGALLGRSLKTAARRLHALASDTVARISRVASRGRAARVKLLDERERARRLKQASDEKVRVAREKASELGLRPPLPPPGRLDDGIEALIASTKKRIASAAGPPPRAAT